MPLALASVVITMTVGVVAIAMATRIVMVTAKTGTKGGMRGARREVRLLDYDTEYGFYCKS